MKILPELEEYYTYEKKTPYKVKSNKGLAFCRVSSIGQYKEDASPKTQLKSIKEYAKQEGKSITKHLDYIESSGKGANRASFKELLEYVSNPENDISTVYVYHSYRFGRDTVVCGAMLDKLIKLGIEFIDISDPIDIFTELGRIRQLDKFLDSEKDNLARNKQNMDGIINSVKQGNYIPTPPRGYKKVYGKKGRKKVQYIVHTDEMSVIKKAFRKRIDNHESITQIKKWMNNQGVKISRQGISDMFTRPFYCGLCADRWTLRVHGTTIVGKQEPIISQQEHKLLIGMLNPNRTKSTVSDNPKMPLRRHLVCSGCGNNMTGYEITKKNQAYYTCNKCDTKNHSNVNKIHPLYLDLLDQYTIKEEYYDVVKHHIYEYLVKTNNEIVAANDKLRERITEKYQLKENLIITMANASSAIAKDMEKVIMKANKEIETIEAEIDENKKKIVDPVNSVNKALSFGVSLHDMWEKGNLQTRKLIQNIAFPEGVTFLEKSNTLKPVIVNPILRLMRFLNDLNSEDNLNNDPDNPNPIIDGFDQGRTLQNSNDFSENPVNKGFDEVQNDQIITNENNKMNVVEFTLHRLNYDRNDLLINIDKIEEFTNWLYWVEVNEE